MCRLVGFLPAGVRNSHVRMVLRLEKGIFLSEFFSEELKSAYFRRDRCSYIRWQTFLKNSFLFRPVKDSTKSKNKGPKFMKSCDFKKAWILKFVLQNEIIFGEVKWFAVSRESERFAHDIILSRFQCFSQITFRWDGSLFCLHIYPRENYNIAGKCCLAITLICIPTFLHQMLTSQAQNINHLSGFTPSQRSPERSHEPPTCLEELHIFILFRNSPKYASSP